MTTSAWIAMAVTMSVITFFTVQYFVMVLRAPPPREDDEGGAPKPPG